MSAAVALRSYFGLTGAASRMLAALYDAGPEPTLVTWLGEIAGVDQAAAWRALVEIEDAMEPGALLGGERGFRQLSRSGVAECERAQAEAYQRGRAA